MECTQARDLMLDAADGMLVGRSLDAFDDHLSRCTSCREEFGIVQGTSEALREAVGLLAPERTYLTSDRLERLMASTSHGPKIFKLVTYKQFVAAAAMIAILMSGVVVTSNVRRLLNPPEVSVAVSTNSPASYLPVVVMADGQGSPLNVLTMASTGGRAEFVDRAPEGRIIPTSTPGMVVPVNHAFYDADEASRWW